MIKIKKHPLTLKVVITIVISAFTTAGFAARIVPTGKVSIIEDGKVVGEFSQEAPFPEATLLRCEAKCAVKLDDVYMVAVRDTVFSVTPMANRHEVLIHKGTLYYALNKNSRLLNFDTPAGMATTGDFSMTEAELRGYVRVIGNEAEIGVISGGLMMLKTESGEMAIASGKKVTMTLAGAGETVPVASGQQGLSTNTKIALGVVGAAAATGGIILLIRSSGDGNGGDGGSPAAP